MPGPGVLQPVVSMMVCVGITHPVGHEAQGLVTTWVGVIGQQALLEGSSAIRGGTTGKGAACVYQGVGTSHLQGT